MELVGTENERSIGGVGAAGLENPGGREIVRGDDDSPRVDPFKGD